MKYRAVLPDEKPEFDSKEGALNFAKEKAGSLKRAVSIEKKNGEKWETKIMVYPNGEVQEGMGGFGFFKDLPVK